MRFQPSLVTTILLALAAVLFAEPQSEVPDETYAWSHLRQYYGVSTDPVWIAGNVPGGAIRKSVTPLLLDKLHDYALSLRQKAELFGLSLVYKQGRALEDALFMGLLAEYPSSGKRRFLLYHFDVGEEKFIESAIKEFRANPPAKPPTEKATGEPERR